MPSRRVRIFSLSRSDLCRGVVACAHCRQKNCLCQVVFPYACRSCERLSHCASCNEHAVPRGGLCLVSFRLLGCRIRRRKRYGGRGAVWARRISLCRIAFLRGGVYSLCGAYSIECVFLFAGDCAPRRGARICHPSEGGKGAPRQSGADRGQALSAGGRIRRAGRAARAAGKRRIGRPAL